MTIDDIKALIAPDESRTLELKKTTGELKDGMHAACAFLNTDGGWLVSSATINLNSSTINVPKGISLTSLTQGWHFFSSISISVEK